MDKELIGTPVCLEKESGINPEGSGCLKDFKPEKETVQFALYIKMAVRKVENGVRLETKELVWGYQRTASKR